MDANIKDLFRTAAVILIAVSGMACASKSGDGSVQTDNTTTSVAPTPTPTPTGDLNDYFAGYSGGSSQFVIDGGTSSYNLNSAQMSLLTQYVGTHPLNAPTNFRIRVDLTDETGYGQWGGTVQLGYYDNNNSSPTLSEFTTDNPSGTTTVRVSYHDTYKDFPNAAFNQWLTLSGKQVFHGFFQDGLGSIVLVIDNSATVDLGDGLGSTVVSGSIYFKNFRTAPAPQFQDVNNDGVLDGEMCWFLFSPSPYACGTFLNSSGVVQGNTALYPSSSDGYTRLGTFSNLVRTKAFHN